MKFICAITITFIILSNSCLSQTSELGSWNILNLKYNIDNKFIVFG